MGGDRPVYHIYVDVVGLQAAQAGFAVLAKHRRLCVGRADLGTDDGPVPSVRESLPQHLLALARVVSFSGIKEIDTMVECRVDGSDRETLLLVSPPWPPAEGPAPQAEHRYTDVRSS
jgi:hypothetical protein